MEKKHFLSVSTITKMTSCGCVFYFHSNGSLHVLELRVLLLHDRRCTLRQRLQMIIKYSKNDMNNPNKSNLGRNL